MEGKRFDELTRAFSDRASRRRVVRGLTGGIAGALLAALGVDRTRADRGGTQRRCRAQGQPCKFDKQCCPGLPCSGGFCLACSPFNPTIQPCLDPTTGFGRCTDTNFDRNNCGACGEACAADETCCGGVCHPTAVCDQGCACRTNSAGTFCACLCSACPGDSDTFCCDGVCIGEAIFTDPNNCGACGRACQAGEQCASGNCVAA